MTNALTVLGDATEANEALPADKPSRGRRLALARPALEAALAAVDATPDFASNPDEHIERRVLAKIEAYRAWLEEHDLLPPRDGLRPSTVLVLKAIKHYEYKPSEAVRLAISSLADLIVGGDAFRHVPERAVDLFLDVYADDVAARGYGLPRRRDDGEICWMTAAADAKLRLCDLDAISMNRLRAIDRTVDGPGIIVDPTEPPLVKGDRRPPNPAARGLIETAIAKMAGGLVEDPLEPGTVLISEFAEQAGVAVRDILDSPSNLALVTGAAASAGLVPHPAIAQRVYTYRQLKQFGRDIRRKEAAHRADVGLAARETVGALTKFIGGGSTASPDDQLVPADFADKVAAAIAAYTGEHGSGWKTEMERWIAYNDALRATLPLPGGFAAAVRVLMAETGTTVYRVRQECEAAAREWTLGKSVPSHKSEKSFQHLCKMLRIPVGRLSPMIASEWRKHLVDRPDARQNLLNRVLPADFRDLTPAQQAALLEERHATHAVQPTEHARKIAEAMKDEYRLAETDWTPAMLAAFETLIPEPKKKKMLRAPGQRTTREDVPLVERREWRVASIKFAKHLLSYTLGYFAKPAAEGTVDVSDLRPDDDENADGKFTVEPGLGIPTELLHPAIFAFIDLVTLHVWWSKRRNGGKLSPAIIDTVAHIMELLKPGTGHVWKNPGFITQLEKLDEWWRENEPVSNGGQPLFDIEPFREDWQAAIEQEYNQLALDLVQYKRNRTRALRDSFAPVSVFIEHASPMWHYMAGVRNLLASKPITTQSRHGHTRDCVMTLILVQTALRARNMLLRIGGQDPTIRKETDEDGNVLWRIRISGDEFKNYGSPHFAKDRDFNFVLEDEDGLYSLLDRYVEQARPYLLAGRDSDAFFVTANGNDFWTGQISSAYRKITAMHFVYNEATGRGVKGAMAHGVHAVRHIVATHIVKTEGDLYVAAFALQDSPRTIERHYARFLPGDRLRLAAKVLKQARMGLQTGRDDTAVAATVMRGALYEANAIQARAT